MSCLRHRASSSRRRAFSLLEIMVAVTLLTVIIAGLTIMFNETKRAFRRSTNQADVLESGRATMDLIAQWIKETAPSQVTNGVNFYVGPFNPVARVYAQMLPDGSDRLNVLEDIFVLTRANNLEQGVTEWHTVKFAFDPAEASLGVATLYMKTNVALPSDVPIVTAGRFVQEPATTTNATFRRVIDGVVHLMVLAYDASGTLRTNSTNNPPLIMAQPVANSGNEFFAYEYSEQAVPAYVDVELGILEPQTLAQFKAFAQANAPAAADFLTNRAGRVQLFRQRIPIRSENRFLP